MVIAEMGGVQRSTLFRVSCLALTVTAMTFAIRAALLDPLGAEFGLSREQLGWVTAMAFAGFPAATLLGGLIYNSVGPRPIMIFAFIGHLLGFLLTIFAGDFAGLLVSTFFVGFANGAVEAACNPMIASMYPDKRSTMLNRFHVWFPGGIVIGALASLAIQSLAPGFGFESTWQIEIAVMIPLTLLYGYFAFAVRWPIPSEDTVLENDTGANIKALFTPLFIFICALMTVTATVELGTQQWVGPLLSASGANPLIILAIVTGLMAVGRYFAGPLLDRIGTIGVLIFSAVVSTAGVAALGMASGGLVYLAAVVFAIGVCFFWPTMLGFVAEYLPKTGAPGIAIVGGVGMLGLAMWQPVIGAWLDAGVTAAEASGLAGEAASLFAGQEVLQRLLLLPVGLVVAFVVLRFAVKKPEGSPVFQAH